MTEPLTVFIPEPEWPDSHRLLDGIATVVVGEPGVRYTPDRLIEALAAVDGIIITSQHRMTRQVLEAAPRLKVIAKYGSRPGQDNVDLAAATERGIVVSYTPGANADSVAEHTVALILSLLHRIGPTSEALRRGEWRDLSRLGQELWHKTVGLVGLGTVGLKVVEKLVGFDVTLLAYDPYASDETLQRAGARRVTLPELMAESDVITVHAILSPETENLIGEAELRLCRPGAFVVNTARGAIIDEAALARALREGWIAGAALDVFTQEPPAADNPLLALPNVLATPHFASCTVDAYRKEAEMAIQEVIRVLTGERPLHVANPDVLTRLSWR